MATPSIRAHADGSDSAGTTLTISKPTGTASGDYMLFSFAKDDSDDPSPDTGWTNDTTLGGTMSTAEGRTHTKIAGGSEGTSYSVSWSGTEAAAGKCITIQDTDGIDVKDGDFSTSNRDNGSVSVTVTDNNSLAVAMCFSEDGDSVFSAPDGTWTEVGSTVSAGTGVVGAAMTAFYKVLAAGATGTLTFAHDTGQEFGISLVVYSPTAGGGFQSAWAAGANKLIGAGVVS